MVYSKSSLIYIKLWCIACVGATYTDKDKIHVEMVRLE